MGGSSDQSWDGHERNVAIWALVRRQHGAISRRQLLKLGLSPRQIERRIASGRLHPTWRGVYAVGRPLLDRQGRWMAAVLACGSGAALSHGSAAALWGFGKEKGGTIDISVPVRRRGRLRGIWIHRRTEAVLEDVLTRDGIPLTSPIRTLIDQATRLRPMQLERAVNGCAARVPRRLSRPTRRRAAEKAPRPARLSAQRLRARAADEAACAGRWTPSAGDESVGERL